MCVHALQIAAMFRPVPTAPGHDLFPQGAHADCLYVLQDGEVTGASSWPAFRLSPSSTLPWLWLANNLLQKPIISYCARCSWRCTETRSRSSESAPLTSLVSTACTAEGRGRDTEQGGCVRCWTASSCLLSVARRAVGAECFGARRRRGPSSAAPGVREVRCCACSPFTAEVALLLQPSAFALMSRADVLHHTAPLLPCRAMSLSMLWELRMSDLHPLLNAHPHLQHDLCADVIEVPAPETPFSTPAAAL